MIFKEYTKNGEEILVEMTKAEEEMLLKMADEAFPDDVDDDDLREFFAHEIQVMDLLKVWTESQYLDQTYATQLGNA